MDYGLAFYRNQRMIHYETPRTASPPPSTSSSSPPPDQADLDRYLAGRIYEPLFLYETQGLAVYRVYAPR